MSEWKTYRLGEIAEIIMGQSPMGETCNENGDGIPLLNGPTEFGSHYPTPVQYTTDAKKLSKINDILFCVRGSTTGKMNWSDRQYAIGRGIAAIRHKNGNQYRYFLRGVIDNNIKNILGIATGSTFPNISGEQLREFEISAPKDLSTQKEIASILSSLDDKIELNLQMNQTLEAMAQAIFKEWFVNFNFPGFDGELVDGLPKGWRMGTLGDVCERITKGTTPTTLKKQFVEKGINFIKAEGIDDFGNFITEKFAFIDEETNEMLKRSIIQENDIVFTIAGTLGRVAKVDKSIIPANTNQAVAIIRVSEGEMVNFVYHLLRSDLIKNTLICKAVHAVQANISLGVLSAAEIIIPSKKIIEQFNDVLNPIQEKLLSNVYEIRTLSEIRDSLLPKLMTGKIEIKE